MKTTPLTLLFTLLYLQASLCPILDLSWIEEPDCNDCISTVSLIESQGQSYVAFFGNQLLCSDALTTIYDCNGVEICLQGGIAGYTQCDPIFADYGVVSRLWDQAEICCIDECKIDEDYVCSNIFLPVCGCDGITYQNECFAQIHAGVNTFTDGACTCDIGNLNWLEEPDCSDCVSSIKVVSFNGDTFIVFWADDKNCSDAMTIVYDCNGSIVCTKGGITGINQCPSFFNSYVYMNTLYEKKINCCYDPSIIDLQSPCPTVIAPVCGCDGNTYQNSCEASYYSGITSWTEGACGTCDVDNMLWYEEPTCNSCIQSVQLIFVNNQAYVVFLGDDTNCQDAITTIYDCCGNFVCQSGGILGSSDCDPILQQILSSIEIWNQTIDCCPQIINLANTTLYNGLHHAYQSVHSSSQIAPVNDVSFKAGQYIELLNNFEVPFSATFLAQIEACQ